jgi:tryptophan synthase beta chain
MDRKIYLQEKDIPRQWYNMAADLPTAPLPPLGPGGKPVSPEMLARCSPMNIIEQEVSTQRWIPIPEEVLDMCTLASGPLRRAVYLERQLKTPARIYYKNESISPAGSHKPNTAIPQAWYNKQFGIKKLVTETGAGQWGSALAFACALIGLECKVYMVRVSFDQKPFRRLMMHAWGAKCIASPSSRTPAARSSPRCPTRPARWASRSPAIEQAVTDPTGKTRYSLGSVLNHVLLHQTIIGLEAKKQLAKAGEKKVDVVIGCVGGGSNFAGLAFPFTPIRSTGPRSTLSPSSRRPARR